MKTKKQIIQRIKELRKLKRQFKDNDLYGGIDEDISGLEKKSEISWVIDNLKWVLEDD